MMSVEFRKGAGTALTRALTRAARAVTARVEQVLGADGLTVDQWLVIEALEAAAGLSMAELATETMITGPTLTRVVDRLVSTATVYREVDTADRRRVRVYLSSRGRAAYRRISAKVEEVESELLERVPAPADVVRALTRLAE